MKFKEGQKARVKESLKPFGIYNGIQVTPQMAKLSGKTVIIQKVLIGRYYALYGSDALWNDLLLEESSDLAEGHHAG